MSDYLANLAARAIAQPTLRPRMRMRFEPEAIDEAPPIATTPSPAPAIERRIAIAAPVDRGQRERATEPNDDHRRRATDETHETERRPPARPPVRTALTAAEPTVIKTHSAPDAEDAERDTPKDLRRGNEARVGDQHPAHRLDAPSSGETARNCVRDDKRSSEAAAPAHRFDEQPPRLEPERERITAAQSSPSRERSHRSDRRAHSREQPATTAPSEPVVHVSIGRIEVRAVGADSAPPRNAKRTPAMTIDDYVARRDAKGRR